MARLYDILYFLRQIFFPNWIDREEDAEPTGWRKFLAAMLLFFTSRDGTGAVFSIVLHAFILVILALLTFSQSGSLTGIDILGGFSVPGTEAAPMVIAPADSEEVTDRTQPQETASESQQSPTPKDNNADVNDVSITDEHPTSAAAETLRDPELPGAESSPLRTVGGFVSGGGFDNRSPVGRQRALQNGDSSQRGEASVESALEWLAAHQQNDGGWSLHFDDSCKRCSRSGTSPTNRRTAATALALLPFLGAGYSHQTESRYKSVVERGLNFLIKNPNGGIDGAAIQMDDLRMYSYGLASIALCEAYAMNPTPELRKAAQKSLLTIELAQDPDYGGWNYRQDQRYRQNLAQENARVGGDTSIFAWQLMALKSGKIGDLNVSQSVLYAAQDFLDLVKWDGGRQYLYLQNGEWDVERGIDSPKTCTAIGLLMRMYLGWKPGNIYLDDGMAQIMRWGYKPDAKRCNLYYIYYATLALHHYGGEHWDTWNSELQEFLIQTQSRQGFESGSWYFPDGYCDVGGRLLNTALATMVLETPYRIMPLYRKIQ